MPRKYLLLAVLLAMMSFTACHMPVQPLTPGPTMGRVAPEQWPELDDDLDSESLSRALEQSRVYLRRIPPDRRFRFGPDEYTAAHLLRSLDVFETLLRSLGPGPSLRQALTRDFVLYQSVGRDGRGQVLFTGYYEPLLNGALTRGGTCQWPVYTLPDDIIEVHLTDFAGDLPGRTIKGRLDGRRLMPYYTRFEIDRRNALAGRGLEIVWVDDPIGLFFLHIQGSGRVRLTDGTTWSVGYAGNNGRPYRSLGRFMIDQGLVAAEDMSMQSIRDWLAAHPERAAEVLDHNESYVFFRKLEGGPVGNINVPLTPHRSVALDHQLFPKGALAWIKGRKPRVADGQLQGWTDLDRFVLVQDTGGAIRGPGRLDLFFGFGPDAEAAAGRMSEPGTLYFLVLRAERTG